VRNDVPGGDHGLLVPPSGVAKAGGARARVLVEHLRAQIRALEQVPVSLAIPPHRARPLPAPACSLSSPSGGLFTSLLEEEVDQPKPRLAEAGRERGKQQTRFLRLTPLPNPQGGRRFSVDHLKRGGLHQIRAEAYRDHPAALGFALAVIAEQTRQPVAQRELVLWCLTNEAAREWGRPYGPGLIALGLDPALFLIVEAKNAESAAWALEEGLKSGALIAALAGIETKTELVARRLSLAAQASRTPCLLLSTQRQASLPGTMTGWRIAARRSGPRPFDASAPGSPAWQLTLERCRGEAPDRSFIVEFSHESFRLNLSSASFDRSADAGESGKRHRASRR
jgi:protein ImuA